MQLVSEIEALLAEAQLKESRKVKRRRIRWARSHGEPWLEAGQTAVRQGSREAAGSRQA